MGKPGSAGAAAAWLAKGYLPLHMAIGAVSGASAGMLLSMLKGKNPKLIELSKKKRFFDNKIREMRNEQWLEDIIKIKKQLDSKSLDSLSRRKLEQEYIDLLDNEKHTDRR